MSATIKLYASWPGERSAGIRSGSETVTITLEYSDRFEPDDVEAFRQTVSEMYDGATVLTQEQQDRVDALLSGLAPAFHYVPLLRPVSFCTIPKGIKWDYVEAPDAVIAMRRGLPLSSHRHGVISTDRELTADECEQYAMKRV